MLQLEIGGDGIATLTLDRPQALNALSAELIEGLLRALAQVRDEPAARVLLLTARGRAFCAGADLRDPMMNTEAPAAERGRRFLAAADAGVHALARALFHLGKPKVAAVNGLAVGGGGALALAADIVIAGESAYFQMPFTSQLGLAPDMGASWHLVHRLGPARAMAVMLLGERLSARQAADWGLVWQCVPDEALAETARSTAARLAQGAPRALAALPPLLAAALESGFDAQLDLERDTQAALVQTEDFLEAVRAFTHKQAPAFKGR